MLNGLDLFSGIGGIALALAPWVRPVAYCEIDQYAQAVLLSRMSDGSIPTAPVWDDVRTLAGRYLPAIDIITGGFPCQDISIAGAGRGLDGERSGLFFEIARLAGELRPSFIFLENVPAITIRGGREVVGTLTALGYDCRWCVISAASVGANHIRERWFLLAHANGEQYQSSTQTERRAAPSQLLADPSGEGLPISKQPGKPGPAEHKFFQGATASERDWWAVEPDVGRVAYGIPCRVDRIKELGNGVVPLHPATAFQFLAGLMKGV